VHDQAARRDSLVQVALIHFVSNLTAVLVGLGLFAAVLLVILRRAGVSLSRVAPAEPVTLQGSAEAAPLPLAALEPFNLPENATWTSLDLGPTYADELRQKQQEARQQEEAMLRHIFEQNLRLRQEIAGLQDAGA
jgi:hypothetical protein